MGSVCSCKNNNNNEELIERAYRRRLRLEYKEYEEDYEEDKIEHGILSDNEDN